MSFSQSINISVLFPSFPLFSSKYFLFYVLSISSPPFLYLSRSLFLYLKIVVDTESPGTVEMAGSSSSRAGGCGEREVVFKFAEVVDFLKVGLGLVRDEATIPAACPD